MTTKLERPMKREVDINGVAHTVTLDESGVKVTKKGNRNGSEISWQQLAEGQAPTVTK
jgi:hypothetical protein